MEKSYNIGEVITGLRNEYLQIKENLTNIKNQLDILHDSKNIYDEQNIVVKILPNNNVGIFNKDKKGRLFEIGQLDMYNLLDNKNSEICVFNKDMTLGLVVDENVEKTIQSLLKMPILNGCIKYEATFNENQIIRMFISVYGIMNGLRTKDKLDFALDYKGYIDEIHSISEFKTNHAKYIQRVLNYDVPVSIFPEKMQEEINKNGSNEIYVKEIGKDVNFDIYCFNEQGSKLIRKR